MSQVPVPVETPVQAGPSAGLVRVTLFLSVLVLGAAALVYVARYVLLVVNRSTLLNSILAFAANVIAVLASVGALAALIVSAVTVTRWLIARRARAYSHYGLSEQRSIRALWLGCLVPVVNLFWAPVYVTELANIEERRAPMRRPIALWWIAWAFSYLVSICATVTSWARDAQGIANNTVLMVFAYLLAAATMAAVARVFGIFERTPVERPAHRWVFMDVSADHGAEHGADQDRPGRPAEPVSARPVEPEGQEPAA